MKGIFSVLDENQAGVLSKTADCLHDGAITSTALPLVKRTIMRYPI